MGALPESLSKSRTARCRAVGAVLGLVLLVGAVDLHDPNLAPALYATPTPTPAPGTECDGECRHIEKGCLLAPDHQPATRPGGPSALSVDRILSPAAPAASGQQQAPRAAPAVWSPVGRPSSPRAPPGR